MKKSKVLGVALVAAMITTIAATAAFSASAAVSTANGIVGETVGITGSFNNWGKDENGATIDDVPMTNNNGVWEGTIHVDSVTEAMIQEAKTDPGDGIKVSRGFNGITFKVRTNGNWTNSWGDYEEAFERTFNSQTDCAVPESDFEVGKPLTIKVTLDTTKVHPDSSFDIDDKDAYLVWPVTYEVVKEEVPVKSEEPSTTDVTAANANNTDTNNTADTTTDTYTTDTTNTIGATSETPATQTSTDTTTVPTGDATSAAALAAVVIASLGTAVVMTKKASSKD